MRVTAIPAQVTTVEDRIVGSLNLSQLLLLCAPVFAGGLLYAVLPPTMNIVLYKLLVLAALAFACGLLSIRIKGAIVLHWAGILLRYWLRPRYYVFDKRSAHGRDQYKETSVEIAEEATNETPQPARKAPQLSLEDVMRVQDLIANPAANIAFETKKRGLYVRITEVRQES